MSHFPAFMCPVPTSSRPAPVNDVFFLIPWDVGAFVVGRDVGLEVIGRRDHDVIKCGELSGGEDRDKFRCVGEGTGRGEVAVLSGEGGGVETNVLGLGDVCNEGDFARCWWWDKGGACERLRRTRERNGVPDNLFVLGGKGYGLDL